ncbi:MAG: radical SAM protein [Chitinophagales bacterium]
MYNLIEDIKTKINEGKNHQKAIDAGFQPLDRKQYSKFNKFRPDGAKQIFCYLPFNSLTFSFSGDVYVCSYNRDVVLGKYPENSIKEIWEGQKAQKLRRHMRNNDLEYGCRHCKFFFDKGKFTNLRPLVFDKYYKHTNGDHPRVFEFEIDNKCNLECQMCNGEVSSSIRKNRDKLPPIPCPYDDAFVEQLEEYIPTLKEAKFYGGEPFMIPLYYKIWDKIQKLNPELELFVITNGTLWNKNIERLMNELNFDVAISIDALDKGKLEKIRKNVEKETLLENINKFNEICRRKNKHLSLSFTIQKDNWDQLPAHIELCNSIDAFAYISYLENPIQFSILELPHDEIAKIREWMDKFTFPTGTPKEKHNNRCFQDYKTYLDAYLKNSGEKRYGDYEFAPDWQAEDDKKLKEEIENISVDPDVNRKMLIDKCKAELVTMSDAADYNLDELIGKLDQTIATFDEESQRKIIGMTLKADVRETLDTLKSKSIEELREFAKVSIPKVVFEE